jgi:hypothetical protein
MSLLVVLSPKSASGAPPVGELILSAVARGTGTLDAMVNRLHETLTLHGARRARHG